MSKQTKQEIKKVLISRTDSIGDVMLTLPMCGWIKENLQVEIYFLGKSYTKAVIDSYEGIDHFIDWEAIQQLPVMERISFFRDLNLDVCIHVFPNKDIATLMKKAKIPMRIGTSHRSFHLLNCNYKLNFSRKNSNFHESQLNFELLRPLGLKELPTIEEVIQYTNAFKAPKLELPLAIDFSTKKEWVILHPKSQGSAVEWPIENYMDLAQKLSESDFGVLFTGTEQEGQSFRSAIPALEGIYDVTGKLTLPQLIALIDRTDHLLACSTGPLHIAGFLGVHAFGLFSPRRPIHPGRWAAIGPKVDILVNDENCLTCKKGKPCTCIQDISVERVRQRIIHANSI